MPASPTREVVHEVSVDAPARTLYDLIADVENWPQVFGPTVHVEHEETGAGSERIRIWATANGTARTWISRRELDPGELRVTFRQEVTQPPVGGMGGAWIIEPVGDSRSTVRLLHDYHAASGEPGDLEWIDQAVDHNSQVELLALKTHAEAVAGAQSPLFTFDDALDIDGAAADAYDFINHADLWPDRLPHVERVTLTEETPGLQLLEMVTLTKDGSSHTTTSVRVCRPHEQIVYKQIQVPALMSLHTGRWLFEERPGARLTVTSRHTVGINEQNITRVLGADAGLEDAQAYVRKALGTNSLATLGHAKAYAEARR